VWLHVLTRCALLSYVAAVRDSDLEAGVAKHGEGKWAQILADQEFHFNERTIVDLKDKWRNWKHYRPYADARTCLVRAHVN